MEANAAQELQEQHEKASGEGEPPNPHLKPVSFTMSVLAVLVAVVTVMGHRTHTQAVLQQARASDQWNLYQAKKIRQYNTQLAEDLLSTAAVRDGADAGKILAGYKAHLTKWDSDLAEEQEKARHFEEQVELAEHRADRFDLGEALLEIALVVTSITLLTRQRAYWVLGMGFGLGGVVVAALAFLFHA